MLDKGSANAVCSEKLLCDEETSIEPYDVDIVRTLPIGLLDREVGVVGAIRNICEVDNPIDARQPNPGTGIHTGNTYYFFLPAGTTLTLENSGGTRTQDFGYIMILNQPKYLADFGYILDLEVPYADSGNSRTLTITPDENLIFQVAFAYDAAIDTVTVTAICS